MRILTWVYGESVDQENCEAKNLRLHLDSSEV